MRFAVLATRKVSAPKLARLGCSLILGFLLVGILLVWPVQPAPLARAATAELFFSEYIEGSSNNKALEIYNGTGAAVDLLAGAYKVEVYSNGGTTVSLTINLTGTVASGDVYVLAHSSAALPEILAQVDQTNGGGWFNGNDAVVLRKGSNVIDAIGQVGVDPITEWGSGNQSTADNTLRRKATVCQGDTNELDTFDPALEWDGFAQNDAAGLGSHTAACNGAILTLSKSASPNTRVAPNGLVTYTIILSNGGGADVTSQLTDTLPVQVAFAGWVVQPAGAGVSSGEVTWSGTVTAGQAISLIFVVTNTATSGTVSNAVTADGAGPAQANFEVDECGNPATLISAIQGNTPTSPLNGAAATIEGIVVGDFQNNALPDGGDLGGFYVQEESGQHDGDPSTSEGIFVYAPSAADVSPGDLVRVTGTVGEYVTSSSDVLSQTQLSTITGLALCGATSLPAPVDINFPVSAITDFERYEGMLVRFPQELVIAEYFNFDRFGEVVLALPLPGQDRPIQPTSIITPGTAANDLQQANDLRRITLDDGRAVQNPDPAIHPNGNIFDLSNRFRGGDTVTGAVGVIDESFDVYRLQPVAAPTYTAQNPRPQSPENVGGRLKVASFNVLNYFTTLDNGSPICGPGSNLECRGADANQPDEFTRQRTKIIGAVVAINADIVGLIEIENHPQDEAVKDLVTGINTELGGGQVYTYVGTGPIGTDAIKVALIYKPAVVTPVGSYQILDSSDDARFLDTLNRPVLIQTFMEQSSGELLTVAHNHLKSKGSACDSVGDPDMDDGQGNCNLTRKNAMLALVDYLATDPTGSGDPDFLIIGDLNSYAMEDPIKAAEAAGYRNLIRQFQGQLAYSYVFGGQFGYLDHALASAALAGQVTGATEWHINADEPDILDYDTSFKRPAQDLLYEPNAFRSSDHDPVIVGLALASQIEYYLPLILK